MIRALCALPTITPLRRFCCRFFASSSTPTPPPVSPSVLSSTVKLPGNRALHVSISGPADGVPVLLIPGLMFGCQFVPTDAHTLSRMNVRLVCVDKPGYGASSFYQADGQPPTYQSFAADLVHVLDSLKIQQTHVIAENICAPYALALSAASPSRVGRVALSDPAPPVLSNMKGAPHKSPGQYFAWLLRRLMPGFHKGLLLGQMGVFIQQPERVLAKLMQRTRPDQEFFANNPALSSGLVEMMKAAVGTTATVSGDARAMALAHQLLLSYADWGVAPEAVMQHVQVWMRFPGLRINHWFALSELPAGELVLVEDHAVITLTQFPRILSGLLAPDKPLGVRTNHYKYKSRSVTVIKASHRVSDEAKEMLS